MIQKGTIVFVLKSSLDNFVSIYIVYSETSLAWWSFILKQSVGCEALISNENGYRYLIHC
jgi:hypothetical protein